MEEIWKRIHAWLDANAPQGYGQLRPGASAESISEAEEAMGQKLPADLKASYLVHDGQFDEPGLIGGEGWCLFSMQETLEKWQAWSKSKDRGRLRSFAAGHVMPVLITILATAILHSQSF
jgi:cell wall assembly regulator SMI1